MRITQNMLANNTLRNLSNSYAKLDTYMNQLNTGKKINRPSDDPVIAMKGIDHRTQITEIEQFKRNTNEVHNWMDNSDASLDKATQALQKLRELAVQASNDTYDQQERKNIKEEVQQLKEHLIDIANTNVNGKYIFNGTDTNEKPVADGGGTISVSGNSSPVLIEVAKGTQLQANVNAGEVFSDELFNTTIQNFIDGLDANNQKDIEKSIGALDADINRVINSRADLGARMNRLDLVENRLEEQEINAKKMMTENENIDYEKVIINLTTQESIHRAALSAASRMLQPTLMDFLR